jgi:hypothetical protein
MMQFWLDDYLPTLYLKTHSLLMAEDLHPSWQIWRDWSFHRYRRIERIFRQCQFDYIHFPEVYWTEVKRDLPSLLAEVRRKQKCIAKIALNQDLHAREKIFPLMAKHSKKARKAVETFLNDFTFRRDRPTCEL